MPLSEQKKQEIRANIGELDYINGTGGLSKDKKSMVKELFLIISSGGVGRKALLELKDMIRQQIDEKEAQRQIRFLAIDTARDELMDLVGEGVLKQSEILIVPHGQALASINPGLMNGTTRKWVHPGLYDLARSNPGFFNGTGASAVRQCGRAMFVQPQTLNMLITSLQSIQANVYAMREYAADLKLNVIFLAGLAGGTGSGTIVDLGFVTRHYLNMILPDMKDRITYSAYLFIPSVNGYTKTWDGSRNAYAALKEIDYFMNLKSLNETFKMDYGTSMVHNGSIEENLFDFCTLVEGLESGSVRDADPAQTSRKIAAETILNMLTAKKAAGPGKEINLADSFLSRNDQQIMQVISSRPDAEFPRESNYVYSVIRYAACVIPSDLLTLYAFKKVFNLIYQNFSAHPEAKMEEAETFLKDCGLDLETVQKNYRSMSADTVRASVERSFGLIFRQKGPYYMLSLIRQAMGRITDPGGGCIARCQAKCHGFLADRKKWIYIIDLYNFLQNELTEGSSLFEIYPFVIEEMKKLLETNVSILTEEAEFKKRFGYSFYWSPISMTVRARENERAVGQYLDGLMDPQRTSQLALRFAERMYEQKERWTGIVSKDGQSTISFDAAGEIRSFIADQMGDLASRKLEDFAVIAFSGDPSTVPFSMVNGVEEPSNVARWAAHSILNRMMHEAVEMPAIRGNFNLPECCNDIYLTIPQECEYLYKAIVDTAGDYGIREENIFGSSSNDRISLFRIYSGVPAWSALWTEKAEENYEDGDGPSAIGLHMEQGPGGRNWAELPNLYSESILARYLNRRGGREAGISNNIREAMMKAREKGILIPEKPLYNIVLFDDHETADTLWSETAPVLEWAREYRPDEIYQILEEMGKIRKRTLRCMGFVATDFFDADKEKLAFEMSCRVLRKNIHERKELERSLEIAEALDERLIDRNITANIIKTAGEAHKAGILKPGRSIYRIILFNDHETADSLWSEVEPFLAENRDYSLNEIYQMLEDMRKTRKRFVECTGSAAADESGSESAFDIFCRILRENNEVRKELERSLEIAKELDKKLWTRDS